MPQPAFQISPCAVTTAPHRWLLLVAVVLSAGSTLVGGHSAVAGSALARVGLSAVAGTLVGLYIALEMVPNQPLLQVRHVEGCAFSFCGSMCTLCL